ncbi:MAG: hypothetical protein M0R03_12485 [Novosphingobium sp.]|nr:hypothetical protein [Novosphingobium sp.]
MSTTLEIYANIGSQDSALGTSGSEFLLVDTDNDELIITAGSDTVKDGEVIAGEDALNQAGVILTGSEITIDKYLLADNSAGIYKEIELAGSSNSRYVFGFSFDGSTSSEPVLEIWDNTDLDSIDNTSLGGGVASSSWWRGITTTDGLPGVGWVGSRLAGSGSGNFLFLNNQNGALTVAKNLYCQLKVVISATQTLAGSEAPVLVIKYATT